MGHGTGLAAKGHIDIGHAGIVGLKPTVGLIPRTYIVPISSTQDTAGPMARSVADAAILLDDIRTTGQWTTDHLLAVIEGCRMDLEQTRYLDLPGLQRYCHLVAGVVGEVAARIFGHAAAAESVKEPGCTRFEVNRQFEQPNLFALSEQYVDQAAMEAHYQTPHFALWKEKSATGFVTKRWSVKGPVLD